MENDDNPADPETLLKLFDVPIAFMHTNRDGTCTGVELGRIPGWKPVWPPLRWQSSSIINDANLWDVFESCAKLFQLMLAEALCQRLPPLL
jgi:hypothetical protein